MDTHTTVRAKRSESLTADEKEALKRYRNGFDSDVACALAIGVDRGVLIGVLLRGSGRPDKIEIVRAALATAKVKSQQ